MYDLSHIKAIRQHLKPHFSREEQISSALEELKLLEPYTAGHSYRVGLIAGKIASALDFSSELIQKITFGGMLHDIGKSGVSIAALCKPSKLSDEEFSDIKKHPELGAQLVQVSPKLIDLIPAILYHHERIDGCGYPFGLSGDMIPIEAKVIAVADTYDAMTSNRSYRQALSHDIAINELTRCINQQFDPMIVQGALQANLESLEL